MLWSFGRQACEIYFPDQGLNLHPLQCRPWKVEFLFLVLFIHLWTVSLAAGCPLLRGLLSSCGEWGRGGGAYPVVVVSPGSVQGLLLVPSTGSGVLGLSGL